MHSLATISAKYAHAHAVQAQQRPPVLAQVSWDKPSDSQPHTAPPQRAMQPPVGPQQLPKDPWATIDPQDTAVAPRPGPNGQGGAGPSGSQHSTLNGSQSLPGLQQPWQGQGGAQQAQRGPQHAQRGQSQGPTSWQGPARKPYMPHLAEQEGFVSQHAQQAGPGVIQQPGQGAQRQSQGPVQPAPGLQAPSQGAHAPGQGQQGERLSGHSEKQQQGQGQRPNRKSPPQSQRAYSGHSSQSGQQGQSQAPADNLPGPPNLPQQQQRTGQGTRRQVVPINPTPTAGQGQGASQQPQQTGMLPPPPRGPQRSGQGQGGSQEALPPPPSRPDGNNASRQVSGQQLGQGSSEQAQPGALKEERSGDLPRRERRGKGRDRSSHDRCTQTAEQECANARFLACTFSCCVVRRKSVAHQLPGVPVQNPHQPF